MSSYPFQLIVIIEILGDKFLPKAITLFEEFIKYGENLNVFAQNFHTPLTVLYELFASQYEWYQNCFWR